ncbi:MAG: SHOCT domain-containing protein [Pirellulales bacterium]
MSNTEALEALTEAIILFATIAVLIAIGAHIASKWRGTKEDNKLSTSELLTKYREMHSRGELSDEEFRNIKSRLANQLQNELSDSDKLG